MRGLIPVAVFGFRGVRGVEHLARAFETLVRCKLWNDSFLKFSSMLYCVIGIALHTISFEDESVCN